MIPDPYDSQSWDRYHYAGNNPLRFVDPTGHEVCNPRECGYAHDNDDDTPASEWVQGVADQYYQTGIQNVLSGDSESLAEDNYSFPDQPDYRSFSIYFGQFGSLLELLFAQLEPTPFTELLSPAAGQLFSGGVTITEDKFGRIYISPGAAIGRTLVSYPLFGLPAISYTYGYIERGKKIGPEGNATKEELDNLLKGGGRSHGFCGPIFPCINRIYSLTSSVSAWEWGFGIPQINFLSLFVGLKP